MIGVMIIPARMVNAVDDASNVTATGVLTTCPIFFNGVSETL
jgi:hypothetical protein